MPKHTFVRSFVGLPAVLALVLAGTVGCGEDERVSQQATKIGELSTQVDDLMTAKAELAKQIDRNARLMRGLSDDIISLREELNERGALSGSAASMAEDEAASAAGMGGAGDGTEESGVTAALDADGDEIVDALNTEDGQKVLEKAMDKMRQRRDSERMDRMVSGMVDRFAEKANLSADQKERMSGIVSDSMGKIRDVWSGMRDARDLSPEAMTQLREDNMAKMGEIREATNEEVKLVLSSDQYLIYEEEQSRMRGFGGGGGGRRGGNRDR